MGARAGKGHGFAINPLVVLLGLLLLALGGFKAWVVWSIQTPSAYATGYKFGVIAAPLICAGLALLVGWIAYRVSGRSESAANAGAGVVLLVPVVAFGIQVGNYLLNGPGPADSPASPALSQPASGLRQPGRNSNPNPPRAGPVVRPIPTEPPPNLPPAAVEAAPLSPPPPVAEVQTPRPPPAAVRPPAPRAENPAIKSTLDALSTELDAATGALLLLAEPFMDSVAKTPPHLRKAIEQRQMDAAELHLAAHNLADRFRAVKDEAERRLKEAGVEPAQASSNSVRYSLEHRSSLRAMACEDYMRLCDGVKEESDFLLDNITKWTTDGKGQLQSKDASLKGRVAGFRVHIDATVARREQISARLRGS